MADTDRTVLVLSQVFTPDTPAVGQYMDDAVRAIGARGHRVVVVTARNAYNDPRKSFPAREKHGNVEIKRVRWSSFGKNSLKLRLIASLFFVLQSIWIGLFTSRLKMILVSTSPPLCPLAAMLVGLLRRVPYVYWVMDLNPDAAVALGVAKEESLSARLLERLSRLSLRRSRRVIVLDRYMAGRVKQKVPRLGRVSVVPPWPLTQHLSNGGSDSFREKYGWDGKRVIMYSGNMGLGLPLQTLLDAACRLRDDARFQFVFIGDGCHREKVVEFKGQNSLENVAVMDYVPLEELSQSLSAADIHCVTMAEGLVGICHPCKIYGAMAVGRPVLYVGPQPSHVTDILGSADIGWSFAHDAGDYVARTIVAASEQDGELSRKGLCARECLDRCFDRATLIGRFCDAVLHHAAERLGEEIVPVTVDACGDGRISG